ncbi:MAG TPA: HisA/HisF-related TIM barrel protein [Candidatus Acidoferrales bacterium]|nr:HisA/HisF-related TIM barrel protein [Candidatus Acidoferrales bacterium]
MVIVPSIDVRGGRLAYRDGVGAALDPRDVAARYVEEGAEELHFVDLDAAEGAPTSNFATLADIARAVRVRVRLAGGVASLQKAEAARNAGFAGVLFSSAVFGDETLLRKCARVPGAIVEIESRGGVLSPRGGPADRGLYAAGLSAETAAKTASLRGVRDLYVIDVATDGRFAGPPLVLLEQLRRAAGPGVALHTGGGVRDVNDVRALAEFGVASVVIGRAFLDGRMTVAEARAACA